jgi:hypothetical protein
MSKSYRVLAAWLLTVAAGADDGGGAVADGGPDATPVYPTVTTHHCDYVPVPATAGAGGTVAAGALEAGAAEAVLNVPVGTALGSYTARAGFLGASSKVDLRKVDISGAFNASIGVETAPRVRALALTAGGETVVIVKADLGFPFEGHTFELEQRLGPEHAGKVLIAASHSHSAWGQYSAHSGIGWVGAGVVRDLVYERVLDDFEAVARAALDARRPARIGVHADQAFDHDDRINRDRRDENDGLPGGDRDDDRLFLIRVDGVDGAPIAILPVFGIHGTIMGADNSLASTDAPGAIERALEEQFDAPVVVMHLQGAVGDNSPVGHGDLDCDAPPGDPEDPCFDWLKIEGLGRAAAPVLLAAWEAAGTDMREQLELEMVTRSVELGPDPDTFAIRGGTLRYGAFDRYTPADGRVHDDSGALLSPIDEFNAPVGAALCDGAAATFPLGQMAGVDGIAPFASCSTVDVAGTILSELLGVEFESAIDRPVCQSTRTTVSALRVGDHLIAAMPGEVTTLLADSVRERSPVAADRTIVVGFGQGEVGYLLMPEDWVLGGYESSINFWGPLEAEYLVERVEQLMPLAMSPEREDAAAGGADRYAPPARGDQLAVDPAPTAGTVPDAVPEEIWARTGPIAHAQPPLSIPRVSGIATFVWIGEDALAATPVVTLERETAPGSGEFTPVVRRSGRPVQDGDLILAYTPVPLRREGEEPRTHYWVAEWQAVPWVGAPGLESLAARAAVPLGRYRFAVSSPGYELASDPFEVEPAALAVAASRDGASLVATVTMEAPTGFRLLDLELPSNRAVPLRDATFDVTVTLAGGGTIERADVQASAEGAIEIDAGVDAARAVSLSVTDGHGNTGASPLPR